MSTPPEQSQRDHAPAFLLLLTDRVATRRGAWIVIALWLLLALVANVAAAQLPAPSRQGNDLPPGAEAQRAATIIQQDFPGQHGTPALVVYARTGGLTAHDLAQARAFAAWLRSPAAPHTIVSVLDPFQGGPAAAGLVSRDHSTLIVAATINAQDPTNTVDALTAQAGNGTGGLEIRVTGPAGIIADAVKVFSQTDAPLLLATVALVLILLGIVYRAPLLALTPIIAVGWAYAIAHALLTVGEHLAGVSINGEAAALVTVLIFGAGTDYTLFIVSRYRSELRRRATPAEAMRTALHSVGEAVLASGSVVVLALLTLLLAQFGTYHDFGVALATSVAVVLVAGLTLIPALLVVLGRAAFWPVIPRYGEAEPPHARFWQWLAHLVTTYPARATTAAVLLLVALATGITGYQERFDFLQSYLRPTPSAQGFTLLRNAFGAGSLAPAQIVLQSTSGPLAATAPAGVARALAATPGVAAVQPSGLSPDGRTALLSLTFSGDPYDLHTIEHIPAIRTRAQAALNVAGGGQALVGGETATSYDSKVLSDRDTRLVVPMVLVLIALILGILLRSALAPFYLLAINALGYGAAFGLLILVNRTLLGSPNASYQFPLDLFVFLTALGADYNIFLLSRVREEARTYPLREAMRHAVEATGGVITSAGIILAGTFAVLAVEPLRDTVEIGLGVALGVLLDTLIVRALLVPGVTLLLGRYAWWPSRLTVSQNTPARFDRAGAAAKPVSLVRQ
jgi:uncharacterized membrane protein YdfJ with MMPL/SSD domain